jgi:hypothetical protein
MPDLKYVPVLTIRLPLAAGGVQVVGQAQIMLDASVDRGLLVAILKHVIEVVQAGRSPEQIAALKL